MGVSSFETWLSWPLFGGSLTWQSLLRVFVCLMVFNAIFKNISIISWRSVLLVEETGGLGENHRHVASHWQTLTPRSDWDLNSQHKWWSALIAYVVVNPTTIRPRPRRSWANVIMLCVKSVVINKRGAVVAVILWVTTTNAINAYHHWCEFESRSGRGVQH